MINWDRGVFAKQSARSAPADDLALISRRQLGTNLKHSSRKPMLLEDCENGN